MSFQHLAVFALTVFVVSIIPGPSMLLALTHGVYFGVKRTLASALGNVTVTLVQAVISIVGLGALLVASETAFQIVKWGGAAYLLYMGISIFISAKSSPLAMEENIEQSTSATKMFLQSALVTAANPKAVIFFTAVFPQFIDPTRPFLTQSIVLTVTCALVAFSCFMIYAICGHKFISFLSKTNVNKYFKRIVGSSFIGSSLALALSNR